MKLECSPLLWCLCAHKRLFNPFEGVALQGDVTQEVHPSAAISLPKGSSRFFRRKAKGGVVLILPPSNSRTRDFPFHAVIHSGTSNKSVSISSMSVGFSPISFLTVVSEQSSFRASWRWFSNGRLFFSPEILSGKADYFTLSIVNPVISENLSAPTAHILCSFHPS